MEKKQFLSISRNFFRENGCQIIKGSRFIRQMATFDVEFQMMHSNFGEYYYLQYYFYLHGANSCYPTTWACSSSRIKVMDTWEIYYLEIDPNDFLAKLEKAYSDTLKPVFELGEPYIVELWKNKKVTFIGDAPNYLQSIDK